VTLTRGELGPLAPTRLPAPSATAVRPIDRCNRVTGRCDARPRVRLRRSVPERTILSLPGHDHEPRRVDDHHQTILPADPHLRAESALWCAIKDDRSDE